jgi:hypothetical protein
VQITGGFTAPPKEQKPTKEKRHKTNGRGDQIARQANNRRDVGSGAYFTYVTESAART